MKGVFTAKPIPSYDDLPEVRYHFPKTYLNHVLRTVDDWIVCYEPRRSSAEMSSRGGCQGYFATARVTRIEQDPGASGLYYAHMDEYIEFDHVAPFFIEGKYLANQPSGRPTGPPAKGPSDGPFGSLANKNTN